MATPYLHFLCPLLFFLLADFAASSNYISDKVFESHESTGRSLLQAVKSCPENFENANYTIVTSQCKGPRYLPKPCCDALLELACPHAEKLNDMSTDCASTMFSYLNLYGKYPPGLFASECRGAKEGLLCPEGSQVPNQGKSSACRGRSHMTFSTNLAMLMLTIGLLVFKLL